MWAKIVGPDNQNIHVKNMGCDDERSIVERHYGLFDLYIGDVAEPTSTHATLADAFASLALREAR